MERSPIYRVLLFCAITVLAAFTLVPSVGSWLKWENTRFVKAVTRVFPFKIRLGSDLVGGREFYRSVDVVGLLTRRAEFLALDLREQIATWEAEQGHKKLNASVYVQGEGAQSKIFVKTTSAADTQTIATLVQKAGGIVNKHYVTNPQYSADKLQFSLSLDQKDATQLQEDATNRTVQLVRDRRSTLGLSYSDIPVSRKGEGYQIEMAGQDQELIASMEEKLSKTAEMHFRIDDGVYPADEKAPPEYWVKLFAYADTQGIKHDSFTLSKPKDGPTQYSRVFLISTDENKLKAFLKNLPEELKAAPDHEFVLEEVKNATDPTWMTRYLKKDFRLNGSYLTESVVTSAADPASFGVNIRWRSDGARLFENMTGPNIGKPMAIVMDDKIISAPMLEAKLSASALITLGGGKQPVTQSMLDEAITLAQYLKAGALPAKLGPGSSHQIGAALGSDIVKRAELAMIIGTIAVILFMLIYYRMAGLIANVAMVCNIVLLLAIMAVFGATLTLPGIASIVLSIGMAVDANIIIYERIREELRAGKTARGAVEAGFGRAFWTVFDAHVVTLLTGIVLYSFGTGPIRGFAAALMAGIICNLFTSVWVSRAFFDVIVNRRPKDAPLSI